MAQIRDYQQVKGTIESSANYSMTTATPSKGRKTRWGSENTPCRLANFTTAITAPMTNEQIDVYVMQVRIEEITQKLRFNDIVPADLDRRVYILTKEFSEVKFIGQLLGLRGRSITDTNARSGATIAIRGKGSIKEGRLRSHERPVTNTNTNNQEGPLHCLITAVTQDKVDRAKELVQGVIDAAVTTPERDNERKRHQLRDLAALNGIFRDDEGRGDVVGGARERIAAAAVICRVCIIEFEFWEIRDNKVSIYK
ncbi:putative branchpoint-bridging protein [Eutypa lata UCREL1]|uniref:Branchpoint-bridging protein n=1 Tax=Eutypa lata (strain UCR-EL1) TaxID=1287681 RepID=M7SF53_EUTLA|nr:putative branchpoint-bridging protein [Eutypa lata UCREL1]